MELRKILKNIISTFLALLVLVFAQPCFTAPVFAAGRKVRVANTKAGFFMELNKAGQPVSGYAYEYIEGIAAYSGWQVEYITAGSFAECLNMVMSGQADMTFDVSYTPERAARLLYPSRPMGTEDYYLYCRPDDKSIHAGDYASLNGKRVGVTKGTSQIARLAAWCSDKGISLSFVEYSSVPAKKAALEAGEIDLILEVNLAAGTKYSALDKIGSDDYYLVVNQNRPELLGDINSACDKLLGIDKYHFEALNKKYFGRTVVSRTLTAEENAWLAAHKTLTVGYMNRYLPFSDTDKNGAPTGIVQDIVPLMFKNINREGAVTIKYRGFDDSSDMYKALSKGEIDTAFPAYGSIGYAKEKGAMFSVGVVDIPLDLAYRGSYSADTTAVIAVNKNNQMQTFYTNYYYPEAKILYFDNIEGCLDAISDGRAGTTILNSIRTPGLLSWGRYSELATLRLPEPVKFSFAVRNGNAALLSLLNRGIANTDASAVITHSYSYMKLMNAYSVSDFIKANTGLVAALAALMLALIILCIYYRLSNKRIAAANRKIVEHSTFTSHFLEPYKSANYIGLDDLTYQIYHREEGMEEEYPVLPNYLDALSKYVARQVHPEDREKFNVLLRPQTVKEMLAEKPEFSFNFRSLPGPDEKIIQFIVFRGADEAHACFGFRDVTEEERQKAQQLELALKNEQMKVNEENYKRVLALEDDFEALFDVNISSGAYNIYVKNKAYFSEVFAKIVEHTGFFDGLQKNIDYIHPNDRAEMLKVMSRDYIREALAENNHFDFYYRDISSGWPVWLRMRFVYKSEMQKNVIVGIFNAEAEMVSKEKAQAERRSVIAKMSGGESLYIVDPATERFQILSQNEYLAGNYTSDENFTESITRYIATDVYGPDRMLATEGISVAAMVRHLEKENEYTVRYRDISSGVPRWYEMRAMRLSESEILYGFTNIDREMSLRLIDEKIRGDNFAIFAADLDNEYVKVLHKSPWDDAYKDGDVIPYREVLLHIAELHSGKAREYYEELADVDFVRKALAVEDKRTYSYVSAFVEGEKWVTVTMYVLNRHADRAPYTVDICFSLLDTLGADRQEMQLRLAMALERAEAANQSKSTFLFNMSHDVRTPMNAITGFTSMAKKYIHDIEKVSDYLNKIDTSGKQLLMLVNQVLEMSRIEAGKIEFDNQPLNMKERFDSTVTIFSEQAGAGGLEFCSSFGEVEHLNVLADDGRIGQILLNILGNAMKYTPEGGRIDFKLNEIPCDKEGRARFVITIADTGIGMSEEFQKVLFEPFAREKTSTVSKIQGTGLGLSIVKNLIDLLGGTIAVQSELGKGTRFDITLDLEIDKNAETGAEETASAGGLMSFDGKRVLLVEDNELNREIAKDILEEFGMLVEEADDGDVAVEMVRETFERGEYDYYNLVLMDIQMPRMNGYEATRAIRELPVPEGVHLPIIAMTANAFEEDKKNAFAAGMDAHLAKPIDMTRFLETLAKYL